MQSICTSVKAINTVGHESDIVTSDCAMVDETAPETVHVGGGLEVGLHKKGQMETALIFANIVGTEDVSKITGVEWCASSSNAGVPGDVDRATLESRCDILSLSYTFPAYLNLTNVAAAQTTLGLTDVSIDLIGAFSVASKASLTAGTSIYVGGRVQNQLSIHGQWMWSSPVEIGVVKADVSAEGGDFMLEAQIPNLDLDAKADSADAQASAEEASTTSISVGAGSAGTLEYSQAAPGRRRLVEESSSPFDVMDTLLRQYFHPTSLKFDLGMQSRRRRLLDMQGRVLSSSAGSSMTYTTNYNTSTLLSTSAF